MISIKTFIALMALTDITSAKYDPANDKFHLPPMNVEPKTVTVAGFGSGSFMSS